MLIKYNNNNNKSNDVCVAQLGEFKLTASGTQSSALQTELTLETYLPSFLPSFLLLTYLLTYLLTSFYLLPYLFLLTYFYLLTYADNHRSKQAMQHSVWFKFGCNSYGFWAYCLNITSKVGGNHIPGVRTEAPKRSFYYNYTTCIIFNKLNTWQLSSFTQIGFNQLDSVFTNQLISQSFQVLVSQ